MPTQPLNSEFVARLVTGIVSEWSRRDREQDSVARFGKHFAPQFLRVIELQGKLHLQQVAAVYAALKKAEEAMDSRDVDVLGSALCGLVSDICVALFPTETTSMQKGIPTQ